MVVFGGVARPSPAVFSVSLAPLLGSVSEFRRASAITGRPRASVIRCSDGPIPALRTCKNCKKPYDPSLNHPRACRFHTAHFGARGHSEARVKYHGETRRKFESVYTGGTMNTPDSGRVFQYWHCCGSEDPFDAGCTAAPHCSYDD